MGVNPEVTLKPISFGRHMVVIPVQILPGIWQHRWTIEPGMEYEFLDPEEPWVQNLWTDNGRSTVVGRSVLMHRVQFEYESSMNLKRSEFSRVFAPIIPKEIEPNV